MRKKIMKHNNMGTAYCTLSKIMLALCHSKTIEEATKFGQRYIGYLKACEDFGILPQEDIEKMADVISTVASLKIVELEWEEKLRRVRK